MILNKVKKVFQVKKSSNKYDKKVPVNICRLIFAKKNYNGNNQKEYRTLLDTVFTFCSCLFFSIILTYRRLLFNGIAL